MVKRTLDQQTSGSGGEPSGPPEPVGSHKLARRDHGISTTSIDRGDREHTGGSDGCEQETTVIFASVLIPGEGDPLTDAAVVIKGKVIHWVGTQKQLPEEYRQDSMKPCRVPVLMPGLWDCHVHFTGVENTSAAAFAISRIMTDPVQAGANLARAVYETLMAGYTSVRCLGGYGTELHRAIEGGAIPGPNIYGAGAAIGQTAGHCDLFELPLDAIRNRLGVEAGHSAPNVIADGVEECRKAVRIQLRRGAKVIKVMASGGVLSRDDDVHLQQFSDEELSVIVTEAQRMGRTVAAHVVGKAGMLAAIRAGCRTLEHGIYLDEEVVTKMEEANTIFVPTRSTLEAFIEHPELLGPESRAKFEQAKEAADRSYRLALEADLTIAFGSDFSGPPGTARGHGSNALELSCGVKFGMTPLQAIKCATVNAVLTVGAQAPPLTGQIRKGYEADVIAIRRNPLEDIDVLRNTDNISHVWKGGKLWKKNGVASFTGRFD